MDSDIYLIAPAGLGPIFKSEQGEGAGKDRDFCKLQKGEGSEVFSVDKSGLIDPGGGDEKHELAIQVGDLPADATGVDNFLARFPAAVTLTNIYICVDTQTGDGSSDQTKITVKRSSDNATIVAYDTPAAAPGLAQATWTTLGALAETAITADEYLYTEYTKQAGGGLALSGLCFLVEYKLAA